jgi:hypothetical protein
MFITVLRHLFTKYIHNHKTVFIRLNGFRNLNVEAALDSVGLLRQKMKKKHFIRLSSVSSSKLLNGA